MMRKVLFGVAAALFGLAPAASGAPSITYDAGTKTILVAGHPKEAPATLAGILAANNAGKWGVVAYDAAKDIYTVSAHLHIGHSDGSTSWLRIGSTEHPAETLIMKGNLVVCPVKELAWHDYTGENGLAIGLPDDKTVKPVVRFDCTKESKFGISLGGGSSFLAYHAQMGALTEDKTRWASWRGSAVHTRIAGCRFAGVTGLYGLQLSPDFDLRDTVFEHMGSVLSNGGQYVLNCTFRHCGTPVIDSGSIHATLVKCRFENNDHNWSLHATKYGILAVDCFFGEPAKKEVLCSSAIWPDGSRNYPVFTAQRHIVVSVKDAAGKPVAGAKVTVINEQGDLSAVAHGVALTGADGKTPAPGTNGALLVTDYLYRATKDPKKPVEKRYTYTLTVAAKGYAQAEDKGIDPDETWAVKEITLKKQ